MNKNWGRLQPTGVAKHRLELHIIEEMKFKFIQIQSLVLLLVLPCNTPRSSATPKQPWALASPTTGPIIPVSMSTIEMTTMRLREMNKQTQSRTRARTEALVFGSLECSFLVSDFFPNRSFCGISWFYEVLWDLWMLVSFHLLIHNGSVCLCLSNVSKCLRLLSSRASNKYVNHTNTKSAYHTAGFLSDKSASFLMRDAALQSFMWENKCHKLSAI